MDIHTFYHIFFKEFYNELTEIKEHIEEKDIKQLDLIKVNLLFEAMKIYTRLKDTEPHKSNIQKAELEISLLSRPSKTKSEKEVEYELNNIEKVNVGVEVVFNKYKNNNENDDLIIEYE